MVICCVFLVEAWKWIKLFDQLIWWLSSFWRWFAIGQWRKFVCQKLTKLQQTLFKWIDFGLIIGSWTPENIFYVADICITVCIVPSISGYVIFQMFESWRKLEDYFPKCFKFIILCVKPVNRFVNKGFMCLLSSFCLYFMLSVILVTVGIGLTDISFRNEALTFTHTKCPDTFCIITFHLSALLPDTNCKQSQRS